MVRFTLANYFWTFDLPWILNDTLLEKTDFSPFASRYKLQITSWLGVGILSSLNLCMLL